MPNGYNGKILHVDLTKGELTVEEPEEAFYRKYLGGSAMGMHYILRDMPKGRRSTWPRKCIDADGRRDDRRADLGSEPLECQCQVADQRRDWRLAKRRIFPC